MSPADSRRASTAACVMAAAAPRCSRTAAQTAPRNSDLVALFSVVLPGNWSAIIWAAVNSRASTVGSNAIQNPTAKRRSPQNMSAVRLIADEVDPLQAGPRNGFIGN
jgi:ABC-type sugar transport system substrate-binding protein